MSEWQPIGTAPKNVDIIIAQPNPYGGPHMVDVAHWSSSDRKWKAAYLVAGRGNPRWERGDAYPTHWKPMPLPGPPEHFKPAPVSRTKS